MFKIKMAVATTIPRNTFLSSITLKVHCLSKKPDQMYYWFSTFSTVVVLKYLRANFLKLPWRNLLRNCNIQYNWDRKLHGINQNAKTTIYSILKLLKGEWRGGYVKILGKAKRYREIFQLKKPESKQKRSWQGFFAQKS